MSKLQLTDSFMDVAMKMSEGNPGGITAIMDILKESSKIDPDSALGPLGPLFMFDENNIYGTDIYILWSDQCNKNTRDLIMLTRACQLGILSHQKLVAVAKDQSRSVRFTEEEMADFDTKVMKQLPNFQPRT